MFKEKRAYLILTATILFNSFILSIFLYLKKEWIFNINLYNLSNNINYLKNNFFKTNNLNIEYIQILIVSIIFVYIFSHFPYFYFFQNVFKELDIPNTVEINLKDTPELFEAVEEILNKINNLYGTKYNYSNFKFFTMTSDFLNVYAYGKNQIILTKEMIALNNEELKGILTHEFSHLLNGDSILKIRMYCCNLFIGIYNLFDTFIQKCLEEFIKSKDEKGTEIVSILKLIALPIYLVTIFINAILSFTKLLIDVIFCFYMRSVELRCDSLAVQLDYKDGLLNVLDKIDYSHSSKSVLEYLYNTHPSKNKRLSRIKNSIIISVNLNENKNKLMKNIVLKIGIFLFFLSLFFYDYKNLKIIDNLNLKNKDNKQRKIQKADKRKKYQGYERDQIIILNNKRVYITKDGYVENF
ncbi:MAG: M48 family metalloprotease [Cetobacterium sp.]|uniref:M48 family metalloprotease n=1 Tax=Cetobacterium sp. TaxID=2071632 RepID=UPI002FC5DCD6